MDGLFHHNGASSVEVRRELLPDLEALIGCWIVEAEYTKRRIARGEYGELEYYRDAMGAYHSHVISFLKHMLAIIHRPYPLDRLLLVREILMCNNGRTPTGKGQLKTAVLRLRNHVPSLLTGNRGTGEDTGVDRTPDSGATELPVGGGVADANGEGIPTDGGTDRGGPSPRQPDDSGDYPGAGHREQVGGRPRGNQPPYHPGPARSRMSTGHPNPLLGGGDGTSRRR